MARQNKKLPKYVQEEIDNYSRQSAYKDFITFKRISLTKKQNELYELIKSNKITICTGYPGTSKTFTSCYAALKLLAEGKHKKIIITKPTEIVGGRDLGALPGSLEEKIAVYKDSFISNFAEMIEGRDLKNLTETLTIEFKPVQFMRGATFKNSVVIIDEIQSYDIKELMAIVTRLGENSRFIFLGDVEQNDIRRKYVAINVFKEILNGINEVGVFQFERQDIVRDPILIAITDKYEQMKAEGKLTSTKGDT